MAYSQSVNLKYKNPIKRNYSIDCNNQYPPQEQNGKGLMQIRVQQHNGLVLQDVLKTCKNTPRGILSSFWKNPIFAVKDIWSKLALETTRVLH